MKHKFLLFLFLLSSLCASSQITIGNGTLAGFNPVVATFKYSWSAMLYTQTQIGVSGQIYSIGFNQHLTQPGYTMNNQRIYMASTSLTTLSTYVPDTTQMTLVYSGSVTWTGPGWNMITLNTNFNYVNNSNLIIFYVNNDGDSLTPSPVDFYHNYPSASIISSKYSMSNFGPAALNSGSNANVLPNLKINLIPSCDLAVVGIPSPTQTITPGTQNVNITVQNFSTVTVTSFNLNWFIDTSQVQTYNWSGSLPSGNITTITVGVRNFPMGNHFIKAWTFLPNMQNDYAPYNDTLTKTILACPGQLSGTYHIGPFPAEFFSFTNAVAGLASCGGISGPVDFLVEPGSYEERIVIPPVTGASATNTVTFEGLTSDSTASKIWEYDATTYALDYVIKLDGADYITIKHLTIENKCLTGNIHNGFGRNIFLANGADYNTITGNYFLTDQSWTPATSMVQRNHICSDNNSVVNSEYNIIDGNYFKRGVSAIWLDVHDTSICASGNRIQNNVINHPTYTSMYLSGQSDLEVIHNSATMKNQFNSTPFDIRNGKNGLLFERNYLSDTTDDVYGGVSITTIHSDSLHPVTIINNMVKLFLENCYSGYHAIAVYHCDYVNAVYNTSVLQMCSGNPNISAIAFSAGYCSRIDFRNNIVRTMIYSPAGFDNNSTDTTHTGYNDCFSLTHFYYSTPPTSNSPGLIHVDPDFVSATDLHLNGHTPANDSIIGHGIPIAGVTIDIDGDLRDPLHPTIGADEYNYVPLETGTLSNNTTIEIYPNPVGDVLFVRGASELDAGKLNVFELYDLSGRLLSSITMTTNLTSVDVSQLPAGFYFYRITSGGEVIKSGKVVKVGER